MKTKCDFCKNVCEVSELHELKFAPHSKDADYAGISLGIDKKDICRKCIKKMAKLDWDRLLGSSDEGVKDYKKICEEIEDKIAEELSEAQYSVNHPLHDEKEYIGRLEGIRAGLAIAMRHIEKIIHSEKGLESEGK